MGVNENEYQNTGTHDCFRITTIEPVLGLRKINHFLQSLFSLFDLSSCECARVDVLFVISI